ncbi:MAG: hypothetical protein ACLFR1_05735 [Spirochaetia bacterium]
MSFLNRGRFILIILFFLAIPVLFIYSGGQGEEDPIQQARELIEERRYNEAILLLTDFIRENPERLNEAQALLDRIRRIREEYNSRYEELIQVLYEEQDVEKALEIIRELETLDTNPNAATLEAVDEARESAAFVYNLNRFNEIMSEATALLEQGNYWEALEVYATGFTLNKDDFDNAEYGNIIKSIVDDSYQQMETIVQQLVALQDDFIQMQQELSALENTSNPVRLEDDIEDAVEIYMDIAELRYGLIEIADTFQEQNRIIQENNSEGQEEFFLSYQYRFIRGRVLVDEKEGLVGTMEIIWQESLDPLVETLTQRVSQTYANGLEAFEVENLSVAERAYSNAGTFASILQSLLSLWTTRLADGSERDLGAEYAEPVQQRIEAFLAAQNSVALSQGYRELIDSIEEVTTIVESAEQTIEGLSESRNSLVEVSSDLALLQEEWQDRQENMIVGQGLGYEVDSIIGQIDQHIEYIAGIGEEIQNQEIQYVTQIADLNYAPLETEYEELVNEADIARDLAEGVETELSEDLGGGTIIARYPGQSIERMNNALERLETLRSETEDHAADLENAEEYVSTDQRFVQKLQRTNTFVERVNSLENRITGIVEDASEQVFLAERYENEGYLRYQEAQNALSAENFDLSRQKITEARDRFNDSLSYQENAELRQETDAMLISLSEEVTRIENEIVVRDVRRMITEGRRFYQLGEFARAEQVFTRAQSRWETTNSEPQPEVEYWLNFVRTALSIQSGRDITETDPLYPEMTRLLNLARQDYEEGREYVNAGNYRDALAEFESAEEKLLRVRIPFPLNQDASLLSLRIEQLKDPENFTELFRERFNAAVEKLDTNPQEAYVELQDLQEINSGWPGMDNAIYEAEVALGIQVPPPDPAAMRRSRQLTEEARRIIQSNITTNFPQALERLNQAIEIYPDNQEAIALKDELQIRIGGGASVVLSSVAEQQYRQAEELFINGNYYQAYGITSRLLENPRNARYQPLVELNRRIESRIQ